MFALAATATALATAVSVATGTLMLAYYSNRTVRAPRTSITIIKNSVGEEGPQFTTPKIVPVTLYSSQHREKLPAGQNQSRTIHAVRGTCSSPPWVN